MSVIENLACVLPPLDEQQEIVQFLAEQAEPFAELIEQAKAGIALLQERRSALISAAVTGKIDVR
jgi:type I restriction enzyme S subunit